MPGQREERRGSLSPRARTRPADAADFGYDRAHASVLHHRGATHGRGGGVALRDFRERISVVEAMARAERGLHRASALRKNSGMKSLVVFSLLGLLSLGAQAAIEGHDVEYQAGNTACQG